MNAGARFDFPQGVLVCPLCATDLESQTCSRCEAEFFNLGRTPCVFTTGLKQRELWQHQMAMMETQGQEALEYMDYLLEGYDLTPRSRARLEMAHDAMGESLEMILDQLKSGGLSSQHSEEFSVSSVDNPTEYYHHILRDWAWDDEPSEHYPTHVNASNLERVLKVWENPSAEHLLCLGAGAGRLSWDLHQHLRPEFSIASDINPFLLSCAQTLIKERSSLTLPELYTYPQMGYPYSKSWCMQPPLDPDGLAKSWYALGADVWNMPLKPHSMDVVVTSWLLDVCGGDVKDLISVIDYLLKPGGLWVNTGPLLYSSQMSFDKKYSAEEILDFADMAGFELEQHSVEEVAHMASPLNARYHHEQIFSFSARKRTVPKALPKPAMNSEWLTPSWLVMHHLPIPNIEFRCEIGHDFIRQTLDLVDGERTIFQIAQMLQSTLPQGVDAKDAVVALFGQILEQMAEGAK